MAKLVVRPAILCAVLLAALAWPAVAQETTATIIGTVTDATGGVLPGVTVVCKHLPTGRAYESVTTETGAFSVPLLPVGPYEVTFTLTGFQPLTVTGLTLAVNDRIAVNGQLKVGGMSETVQVTSEATMVQPTPALQSLVDSTQVQQLPLNNRNFVQLATLSAGVSSLGA